MSDILEEFELFYGAPLSVISNCLRSFLIASPGKDLLAADFSAIEARVLAWLSGQKDTLEVFRGDGKIYEHAASLIYQIPINEVSKAQRQIGKVATLALGYQGGTKAFQKMGYNYGLDIDDREAFKIKEAWRNRNPYIVRLWSELQGAAWYAIQREGKVFKAGTHGIKILFRKVGPHLYMLLPSGRALCYPFAKLDRMPPPYDPLKVQITYKGTVNKKWVKIATYGGKLCENATQAVARDLLAEAMLRLEERGYPIVMHVHDEVVCEVPEDFGSVRELTEVMSELPKWAEGLPISAEGWRSKRYQK